MDMDISNITVFTTLNYHIVSENMLNGHFGSKFLRLVATTGLTLAK